MNRKTLIAAALCASCACCQDSFAAAQLAAQADKQMAAYSAASMAEAPAEEGNEAVGFIQGLEQKCSSKDAKACYDAGTAYAEGIGVEKDERKSLARYKRGCEFGSLDACRSYIGHYEQAKQPQRAADAYMFACDLNDAASCNALGSLLYKGDQDAGIKPDQVSAAAYFFKSCELGHGPGCTSAGAMYYAGSPVARDLVYAVRYFVKGCSLKDPDACSALSGMYKEGQGVVQSRELAGFYLKKAIDLYR